MDIGLKRLICRFFLLIVLLLGAGVFSIAYSQRVISITVDQSINPASAEFIGQSIQKAEEQNAAAILIQLNTPGGLMTSMRGIVSDIMESEVPVIVYVSPSGARAGSAGVFITMAAHIAAMAPGTNIGAAHPVALRGNNDGIMIEKSTNDAAALIRSIAEKRNRNITWAEEAVRMSKSLSETEALNQNVIDLIASDVQALLQKTDSMQIYVSGEYKTLHTAHAEIVPLEMGFFQKILSFISDPNIAYILMMLGFFGLIFELFNPGAIFPGVVGVICLILAFYTMSSLPVNYAAIALIVFGIILYLLEIKIISHGMLAIGGTVSVFLGSMFLFRTSSTDDVAAVSWSVIIAVTLVTLLFFFFIVTMGLRAQKLKPVSGSDNLIGKEGVAMSSIDQEGWVKVDGETWKATTENLPIAPGSSVRVMGRLGLTLTVKNVEPTTNTSS